jgi:hypothetical protein
VFLFSALADPLRDDLQIQGKRAGRECVADRRAWMRGPRVSCGVARWLVKAAPTGSGAWPPGGCAVRMSASGTIPAALVLLLLYTGANNVLLDHSKLVA